MCCQEQWHITEGLCQCNRPPSLIDPQPVIQQVAPGRNDSFGRGKQTGRTPPRNNTQLHKQSNKVTSLQYIVK